MKKTKMISLAAVALLAVAPVVASPISVSAESTTKATNADALTPKAYFTYNGQKLNNNAVLPVGNGLPLKNGMTVKEILDSAKNGLKLESNIKTATTYWETPVRWLITNLQMNGIKVNGNDENATIDLGSVTTYNLTLSAKAINEVNGVKYGSTPVKVIVPFNSNITSSSDPAIVGKYEHDGKGEAINPNGQAFQIAANSAFDPTNIKLTNGGTVKITGQQTSSETVSSKIDIVSNPVDTSKAGSGFTVKLATTNNAGKKVEIEYKVFVLPKGLFQLNLLPQNWVSGPDESTFYQGEKYYVGTDLKYINGEFYSLVSKAQVPIKNRGNWIATKYLANSDVSAPKLAQKTIMHKAIAYGRLGDKTRKVYPAYTTVHINNEPIEINGGKYYQIYNADGTYTNYFVKVGNIDGTKRTLTRNAYIYATSKRRADRTLLRKGDTVTTYGGSYKFKNGKRYYRIEGATASNKRYVKVVNFE